MEDPVEYELINYWPSEESNSRTAMEVKPVRGDISKIPHVYFWGRYWVKARLLSGTMELCDLTVSEAGREPEVIFFRGNKFFYALEDLDETYKELAGNPGLRLLLPAGYPPPGSKLDEEDAEELERWVKIGERLASDPAFQKEYTAKMMSVLDEATNELLDALETPVTD